MIDFLRRIKADFLLSSVLCIALGLVFIIWRSAVLEIIAGILAVGQCICAVISLK